jgi:hypothetical protein
MPSPSPLAKKLLAIALKERGVQEEPRGSNRGPRVDEYQAAATDLEKKFWGAWCASFVCWCMMQAMAGGKYSFTRMTTAGVKYIAPWSKRQDNSTQTKTNPGRDIIPGDILVYDFSHTGIAKTEPDKNGNLTAVEGNTNDDGAREGYEVAERPRNIKNITARIRFTV